MALEKERGHFDRNIRLLNRNHQGDLIEFAPILEDDTEPEGIQLHEMPEEAVPELLDRRKTILVPMVQTMKEEDTLHLIFNSILDKATISSSSCKIKQTNCTLVVFLFLHPTKQTKYFPSTKSSGMGWSRVKLT